MSKLNVNYDNECVAAIVTPLIASGLGVVRISGADAIERADKIFKPFHKQSLINLKGYEAAYGYIIDSDGNKIDDCVVLVFRAPKSFTGENVVEFSCHGGVVVLNLVLQMCFKAGCRQAINGEFTKRAFLNGKLSLTQAEAVVDVINAETELSLKAAQEVKNGKLYNQIQLVNNSLLNLNSKIEAYLNYPDEDIDEPNIDEINTVVTAAIGSLEKLILGYKSATYLKTGIRVAIVGQPNVGKSTLLNLLVGSDKSIVSKISGTTRDVVCDSIEIDGLKFIFYDTAGFRETVDEIEKLGIEKAERTLNESNVILFVVDGSKNFDNEFLKKIDLTSNVLKICVLNKSDLGLVEFNRDNLNFDLFIRTCKDDLDSILNLKTELNKLVRNKISNFNSIVMINERQNGLIKDAIKQLKSILNILNNKIGLDIIGLELELVIDELSKLDGKNVSDELINDIFSKFCVGK